MHFLATIWSVAVFCGPTGTGRDGWYDDQGIRLTNRLCETIVHPQRHPYYEIANAIYVLTHEEGHAHDPVGRSYNIEYNSTCGSVGPCEAYADCFAAGHVKAMALTLGFTKSQAMKYRNYLHTYRHLDGYTTIPQRCWK